MIARLLVVSELCIRDAATNLVSLVNVLDDVLAEAFPIFFPDLSIAIVTERTEADRTSVPCRVVIDLGGDVLFDQSFAVNFFEPHTKLGRVILKLTGLTAKNPGRLTFKLLNEDATVAETWINILSQPTAAAEALPAPMAPAVD